MTFQGHSRNTGRSLAALLRYCPESLEFLRIDYPTIDNHVDTIHWQLPGAPNNLNTSEERLRQFWRDAPSTNIRTLQMPGSVRCNEFLTIIPFLRHRCPKLVTWGPVPTMRPTIGLDLAEVLRGHCLKLENLEFHDLLADMLPLYSQIIMACHALKSLTITGSVNDGRDVVRAAVQYHAKTLAKVRWTGDGGFHGGMDLEAFLSGCSSLERVETTYGATNNFFTGQGAAGAMRIKSKALPTPSPGQPPLHFWACHATLTHLDVTFCPQGDISDVQELRKQVDLTYRKLGQLCALVELRLGCRCRCEGPTLVRCSHFRYNAVNGAQEIMDNYSVWEDDVILNMSLESGLGHLSGLKRLQFLSIARIQGHKIGYAELEWMRDNWRQLQVLCGVRNMRIVEWARRNWAGVRVSYLDSNRAVEVAMAGAM
ncbi:hypothetical protein EDD21DRAFT_371119 [Dissophora ornata]|nr:hypothetical protein EDD21DRAFT_371119 [Dissophora ornata]